METTYRPAYTPAEIQAASSEALTRRAQTLIAIDTRTAAHLLGPDFIEAVSEELEMIADELDARRRALGLDVQRPVQLPAGFLDPRD